ncbi:hypothetical protein AQJ58_11345 [Streptomyces sp. DSM 15324]|nr:hypothetical protein AQJ58_11345 [Streptomyces sp. DSM 15324]
MVRSASRILRACSGWRSTATSVAHLLQEQPHRGDGGELDGLIEGFAQVTIELGKPGERDLLDGFAQGVADDLLGDRLRREAATGEPGRAKSSCWP